MEQWRMNPTSPDGRLTILVLDDDEAMVRTLRRGFEQLKHLVLCALTADEAVELAREHVPDVALLDLNLGEGKENGHSACSRIVELRQATVVFMWSGEPPDEICYESLRLGAVEHLVKPVGIEVLLAKFRARLRLQQESVPASPLPPDFPFELDASTNEVTRRGQPLNLGPDQDRLLSLLLAHLDRVVSFAEIRTHLNSGSEKAAKRIVYRTQRKLRDDGELIENVRAIGFRLRSSKEPAKKKKQSK